MWTLTAIVAGGLVLPAGGWMAPPAPGRPAEIGQATDGLVRTMPDQAKPFLGEWTSLVEGPAGPIAFRIEVKVSEGNVFATVSSDLMGTNDVQDITNTENGISLRYVGQLWGYSAVVVVVLIPVGDQLREDFAIMNRQFEFSGMATRIPTCSCPLGLRPVRAIEVVDAPHRRNASPHGETGRARDLL